MCISSALPLWIIDLKWNRYRFVSCQRNYHRAVYCLLISFPFWIFLAIGSFIDNQRGATLSSTLDPATGVDTSELARLFNLFSAAVYLTNGGLNFILETLWQSYNLWPSGNFNFPKLEPLFSYINNIMTHTIVYASPVIAVMLGSEAVLGLLARYASQLNAFAISLTVKSALAFLILIIYFGPILAERVMPLSFFQNNCNYTLINRVFHGK